jgi:hypothetical protein
LRETDPANPEIIRVIETDPIGLHEMFTRGDYRFAHGSRLSQTFSGLDPAPTGIRIALEQ